MGRRKIEDSDSSSENLFDAMVTNSRNNSGSGQLLTGREADACIIGLPLPSLALRHLFRSTVFPLGRITVLTGEQGSCKSSMLYEMFRWHRRYKGGAFLEETENKDSQQLALSFVDWDDQAIRTTKHKVANDWMKGVDERFDGVKDFCEGTKASPGPGRKILTAIGVDSMTALLSEGTVEEIGKTGVPERRFPLEAGMISNWLKQVAPKVDGWPVSLLFTNHDKPGTDNRGIKQHRMPGGYAPKFHATYILLMTRIGKIETAEFEGRRIKFAMTKNSLGPDGGSIVANMLWRDEIIETPEGPIARQRSLWDWHSASIDFLYERMNHKLKTVANRLKDIIDLHFTSGRRVWSDALGISKDSPIGYRQAGILLEENEELCHSLHRILGISERAVYRPGVDFSAQIDEAQKKAQLTPNVPMVTSDTLDESLLGGDFEESGSDD